MVEAEYTAETAARIGLLHLYKLDRRNRGEHLPRGLIDPKPLFKVTGVMEGHPPLLCPAQDLPDPKIPFGRLKDKFMDIYDLL